jgi:hypothetical protein
MMKNNEKKKGNNAKKILPAAGMLALSASMLATSTYAWFTMSREVEVKNIQMTATVPEDIQISLGNLAKNDHSAVAVESDKISLANSTGVLLGSADDGNATDPVNSWDWSSSADISAYYKFGKLMPASSRDGAVIYYTADATGTGRTVNDVAKYFAANDASGAFKTGGTAAPGTNEDSAKTTLHAYTTKDTDGTVTDTWTGYTKATGWDATNDDGYYVDIPVWLHSSATEDINVSVAGYVLPGSTDATNGKTQTALELYRSVRVAILNGDTQPIKATKTATPDNVTVNSVCVTNNVLPLADAWDLALDGSTTVANTDFTSHLYKAINGISNPFSGSSIVDSGIYLERTTESSGLFAVNNLTAYSAAEIAADLTGHIKDGDNKGVYTSYQTYNGIAPIATIKANTTTDAYGDAKKLIIRVWLDGEDEQCWNDNAGQDWAISLRFTKVDIPAAPSP